MKVAGQIIRPWPNFFHTIHPSKARFLESGLFALMPFPIRRKHRIGRSGRPTLPIEFRHKSGAINSM